MQNSGAVVQRWINAWNAHDAAQVINGFAADGEVYIIPPFPGAPPEFHGIDQVKMFVGAFIAGFHGEFANLVSNGNTVTFYGRLTADGVKAAGIDEVDQNDEVVLVDGKIKSFTIRFTPQTIEKLNKIKPQ